MNRKKLKLSCNTYPKVGMKVLVVNSSGGHKKGVETTITALYGKFINKENVELNLDLWRHVVACGEWLQNVQSLKAVVDD